MTLPSLTEIAAAIIARQGLPPEKGDTGKAGIDGQSIKGDPGRDGVDGAEGPQGPKGDTGPAGPRGLKGLKGDEGDEGERGIQGPMGPVGPVGSGRSLFPRPGGGVPSTLDIQLNAWTGSAWVPVLVTTEGKLQVTS